MPIPFRTDHRSMCFALFLTMAPEVAPRAQVADASATPPVPAVCTANGTLDLNRARELRDMIRKSGISADRLVKIRENLDVAISLCESGLNAATATFSGFGLYENIGENFLRFIVTSKRAFLFASAELLFSRFPHPDVHMAGDAESPCIV